MEIVLRSDFNFTEEEVSWNLLDVALTPIAVEGNTPCKQSFDAFLNLTQIVDKPTFIKGNNILDLILESQGTPRKRCSTEIIQPMSDHHLIKTKLLCKCNMETVDRGLDRIQARRSSFFSMATQIFNTLLEHLRNVDIPEKPT